MRKNIVRNPNGFAVGAGAVVLAMMLAACGGGASPPPAPAAEVTSAADNVRVAELNLRERELAQREAELALQTRERETARVEAENATRQQSEAAAAKAAARKAALARSRSQEQAAAAAARVAAAKAAPAPVLANPIEVPSGTQLVVALSSDLSSKTALPGDPFEARLVSDLMVNDRRAVPAGARVTGTITDVISGSHAIGSVPMLGLKFDRLQLQDGQQIPISGELKEQGKSEKAQDTAKILGGAAAGAVLGHQVKKGDGGKIIGGLLGGAIGAVAAKKTGTEVLLAAGSTLTIALGAGFTVRP